MQEIKKGWKVYKMNDICNKVTDGTHDTPKTLSIGIPLIKGKEINNGTIDFEDCDFISIEDHNKIILRSYPEEGDILFANIGAGVGETVIIKTKKEFSIKNIALFKPNKNLVNNYYLYYYILNPKFKEEIINKKSGSAQPFITLSTLRDQEIFLPPLPTQQKIASILSKYDDLIENNNKRIKILEETAQAIYEEWFVKYNFLGSDNIKMVESGNDDFGMIPEGWEVRSILDIDYFRFIRENLKEYEGEKVYYATADIDGICITGKGENFDFNSKPSRAQKEPILNSVWFARMIETFKLLGFTQTNKEIANRSILSSGMVGFEAEEFIFPFLYYTINSKDFHSIKNLYCTGATQRALTNDGLKQIKVIYPNKNIVENYGKLTKSMIDEMFLLQKQNQNLKETRDLLIPRLVSGELYVESLDVKI